MSAETRTTSSTGGQKGVKIERYDLIPVGPLRALAVHFGKGARKYDDGQWRKGYEWSKTISALMRHLEAFREGLDYDVCSNDPEGCKHREGEVYEADTCFNHTGSHHLDAVMWHSFVLREFYDTHPEHDDRHSTVLARTAAEEEAALLAEQVKLDRNAIWFIPESPKFGTFADLGFSTEDPGLTSDEPTRLTFSDETMVLHLEDVNVDVLRILCGLPVEEIDDFGPLGYSEARFAVSAIRHETEEIDLLALLQERLNRR